MSAPMLLPADPGAAYRAQKDAIDAAVRRVLESGWYLQGTETQAFETEWAAYAGVEHAVTTGTGTDALELALRACGVGPGDRVVTVSHTAVATVTAIDLVGAVPVLVDVDPVTFTMAPDHLEAALEADTDRRIRAVLPVHLYGHPADLPPILESARRRGLRVIEDCAQSHGAELGGRRTGAFGDFGAFSFYPTKNLGALGDGGALVTADTALAERARLLKQYGWRERYVSQLPGMNTRLDEVQAAVLRVKLPQLDRMNDRRRELAALYDRALAAAGLELPRALPGARHVYHQYVVRNSRRDALREALARAGFGTAVLYPVPVHLQPGYRDRVVIGPRGLEETERLCGRILSLPLYPGISDEQALQVSERILRWQEAKES